MNILISVWRIYDYFFYDLEDLYAELYVKTGDKIYWY